MSSSSLRLDLSTLRADALAAGLEFIGTILFLLLGLGGIQAAAFSNNLANQVAESAAGSGPHAINQFASIQQLMYISLSMGFALLTSAWLFFRVTGGVFNPQVALALYAVGAMRTVRFVMYIVAELAGGIVASALLKGLLPGPIAFNVGLGPSVSYAQGVFVEALTTAALVFAVLMLAAEKHKSTAIAPIGIGLTLFACHLFAVMYTGAAMNSARAFGPAVLSGFMTDHWIYWVGPTIGSLIATTLYYLLKYLNYQELNPNQDSHYHAHSAEGLLFKRSTNASSDKIGVEDGRPRSLDTVV